MEKVFTFFKGRVALHAILNAAGIGPGDKVLLPGYTCVVVPNAILYRGARPVYLDIDSATFNLDTNLLENELRSSPMGSFRAVIVQHTYGIPCDMDAILQIAGKYDLLVIEDSCHAIGSKYKGKLVGSFGDAAFFSSQWSKPVTTGLGGWAVVNSPSLATKVEDILPEYQSPSIMESLYLNFQLVAYGFFYHPRLYWLMQSLYRRLGMLGLAIGSSTATELLCEEPSDYMKSMGPIQVRQLEALLKKVESAIRIRRYQKNLVEGFLKEEGLELLEIPYDCEPIVLRYPIRVNNKNAILAEGRRRQIQLGDWFVSPIHPNLDLWQNASYAKGRCPVAESVCTTTVNIPLGPRINDKELERAVRFLGQNAELV